MARYKITSQVDAEDGKLLCTILVVFGKGDSKKEFEQMVYLPAKGTEKAAQDYADDYEKQHNELVANETSTL